MYSPHTWQKKAKLNFGLGDGLTTNVPVVYLAIRRRWVEPRAASPDIDPGRRAELGGPSPLGGPSVFRSKRQCGCANGSCQRNWPHRLHADHEETPTQNSTEKRVKCFWTSRWEILCREFI